MLRTRVEERRNGVIRLESLEGYYQAAAASQGNGRLVSGKTTCSGSASLGYSLGRKPSTYLHKIPLLAKLAKRDGRMMDVNKYASCQSSSVCNQPVPHPARRQPHLNDEQNESGQSAHAKCRSGRVRLTGAHRSRDSDSLRLMLSRVPRMAQFQQPDRPHPQNESSQPVVATRQR